MGPEWFYKEGIELVLVRACGQCNSWLGDAKLFSLRERAQRVGEKLTDLQDSLKTPAWSDEELDELGPGLRGRIETYEIINRGLDRRIEWAEMAANAFADPELRPSAF